MDWFLLSLIASLALAIRSDVNRRLKLDGFRLNFWRSVFSALMLLPFVFIADFPSIEDNPLFYILALITSVVSMVATTIKFNLASQHNGRVANLEGPLKAFTAFFIWLLIDPESLQDLIDRPFIALGVISMMCLATYAMNGMRRHDASWQAFLMIGPMGLLVGILDGVFKLAMPEGSSFALISGYLFIVFGVSSVIAFPVIWFRRNLKRRVWLLGEFGDGKPIVVPGMIMAGFWTALLTVIPAVALFKAFILSPNPGYPSAIMMMIPIWLLVYHKIRKIPDDASPFMGTLMVLSGVGLVIITSYM